MNRLLSVVVYIGKRRWAALSVSKLIEPLSGVAGSDLPPGFSPDVYQVIDVCSFPFAELEREPNPVTTLLQPAQSGGFEDLRLQEEAAHLFLELFAGKFADVPVRVRERVNAASKKQLETWAKRLLRAEKSEGVFEG